jgi:hypothetical protein
MTANTQDPELVETGDRFQVIDSGAIETKEGEPAELRDRADLCQLRASGES